MIPIELIIDTCQRIANQFTPDKIILFGSYAYGKPHNGSDVDLLIIMSFEGRSFDKSMAIWKAIRPPFPTDIIVRKPEDADRRYREFDPLIRNAFDKGKVLYERNSKRVAA